MMAMYADECEIDELISQFIAFKQVEGLTRSTLTDMHGRITRFCRECGFLRAADLNEHSATQFIVNLKSQGRAAATILLQRKYMTGFVKWLVARGLVEENFMERTPRPKHLRRNLTKLRRALSDAELERLVYVARWRPLAECYRRRTTGLKGAKGPFWETHRITVENVKAYAEEAKKILYPGGVRHFERDGRKWALVWSILAYTGIRWGELLQLRVEQFEYAKRSYLRLEASQTKNGNEDFQPVPDWLAKDIRAWIKECKLRGPDRLIPALPEKGIKRFNLDRDAAGIERKNKHGRSVDIHALRYYYATALARNNVQPRTIQKLMRHSTPHLSMVVYMDAAALDHASAAEGLTPLPSIYDDAEIAPMTNREPPTIQKPEASPAPASGQGGGLPSAMAAQLVGAMDADAMKAALIALLSKPAQE